MADDRRSLFRHHDFRQLWCAETVSQVGSQVSLLALPLVAITVLHATTFQVGALTAVEFSPFVLFGLPAGAIVDRLPRRPVLVVFVTGSLTVFFDVAYQSILPALVEREELADGNAKLEVSRSAAQTAGPALAGVLVEWIGATTAILVDAVSFVASAVFIRGIRAKEPPIEPRPDDIGRLRALNHEIREGLRYVLRHRVLRLIAGSTATSNFFASMTMAVFLLYAVRELHYSAAIVGLVFAIGNAGAIVAALTVQRITAAIRLGPTIMLGMLLSSIAGLVIALAPAAHAAVWFTFAWLLFGFGGVIYNIDQVSLRQAITPHRLQGRMNASMRFMVWGTMPFGSLVGGVLGTTIGLRPTLLVAGIGGMTAVLWVLSKPVLALRVIPTAVEEPAT